MEVNISDQGKWEKSVEVKIPYEALVEKFDEAYKKYKKTIQLEGFRKGKVPLDLIKKVFGLKIETEVAENSVSEFLEEAIKQNDIKMYDVEKIDPLEYDRKKGLQFTALVQLQPDVEVAKYKEMEVEKETYQVTDDDIDEVLNNLREQHAAMNNVEGEAKEGHYLVADLQKIDASGVPIIGEKYENRYFQIGTGDKEDKLSEQLLGVKPGDSRNIILPKQSDEEEEDSHFIVDVKEIKEKQLPELTDEFAKSLGGYEDLTTLKDAIRSNIEKQSEDNTKQKLYRSLMDEVIKNNPIDLPDFMVENYLNAFIENMKKDSRQKVDENEIRERYRADAVWNLKWMLIKDKLIEVEKLEVTDDEIEEYIENIAQNAGKNAALVRSNYRSPKQKEQVRTELVEDKLINLILADSKVNEKVVTFKDREKARELVTA